MNITKDIIYIGQDDKDVVRGGAIYDRSVIGNRIGLAGFVPALRALPFGKPPGDLIARRLIQHHLLNLIADFSGNERAAVDSAKHQADILRRDLVWMIRIQRSGRVFKSVVFDGSIGKSSQPDEFIDPRDTGGDVSVSKEREQPVGGFIAGIDDHASQKIDSIFITGKIPAVECFIYRLHDEKLHDTRGTHRNVIDDQILTGGEVLYIDRPGAVIGTDLLLEKPGECMKILRQA